MNNWDVLIISLSLLVALIGGVVAVWSIVRTRKKFYEDYLRRKR